MITASAYNYQIFYFETINILVKLKLLVTTKIVVYFVYFQAINSFEQPVRFARMTPEKYAPAKATTRGVNFS